MAYEELKAAIRRTIKNNDNQEITGDLLQNTLLSIVDTIGTTAGGGSGSGSGSGSGVYLGTLLAQLNNENPFPTDNGQVLTYNGSNFIWKTPTGGSGGSSSSSSYPLTIYNGSSNTDYITYDGSSAAYLRFKSGFSISKTGLGYEISASGGGSGSIQVAQTPEYAGESESWVSATKLRFIGITGTKPTITTNSNKGCVDVGIPTGSGSGSSGTTSGRLRFYKDSSEESWNGESDFKIIFGSGLNITWDSHSQITLSATGGSGGSSGGSVSWENVTNKPSTFTPSTHTHTTSEITGLSNYVQGVKVNNATNADRLLNSRTIWGQSFDGTSDIDGNLYMGTAGGGSIQLWMNNGNMLDRTNNTLHIGYGLKESSDGEIYLDAYATKVYTDNMSKHYDFKSNVFDVNSNQIHFGSETNGGKIYWDAANNAFKIEGNVYATGGITALGVSNNATTSNNVDFTFRSVTIPGNNQNKVQLTDEGLTFANHGVTIAYYKNNSIGLYDSANDASSTIFRFTDGELTFDPNVDSFTIKFNQAIECYTDENTLIVGNNANNGYIVFSAGSTMAFNHNNKNYSFNVAKAIEQGILTI